MQLGRDCGWIRDGMAGLDELTNITDRAADVQHRMDGRKISTERVGSYVF